MPTEAASKSIDRINSKFHGLGSFLVSEIDRLQQKINTIQGKIDRLDQILQALNEVTK